MHEFEQAFLAETAVFIRGYMQQAWWRYMQLHIARVAQFARNWTRGKLSAMRDVWYVFFFSSSSPLQLLKKQRDRERERNRERGRGRKKKEKKKMANQDPTHSSRVSEAMRLGHAGLSLQAEQAAVIIAYIEEHIKQIRTPINPKLSFDSSFFYN